MAAHVGVLALSLHFYCVLRTSHAIVAKKNVGPDELLYEEVDDFSWLKRMFLNEAASLDHLGMVEKQNLQATPLDACLAPLASLSLPEKQIGFKKCVDLAQQRCGSASVEVVTAHNFGFASAMNTWALSFAVVLQQGNIWQPSGAWSYNDPALCPTDSGAHCYYSMPQCEQKKLPAVIATNYLGRAGEGVAFVQSVAATLQVRASWVWGNLVRWIMTNKPTTTQQLKTRTPQFQPGSTAGIQARCGLVTPLNDGRLKLSFNVFMDRLKQLQAKRSTKDTTVMIMTDNPTLKDSSLVPRFPDYSFITPTRAVADLGESRPLPQGKTVADVTFDFLADLEAMARTDIFIGSQSNIFWLVWALRSARPEGAGQACWVDTRQASGPMLCPTDVGFFELTPPGIVPKAD